MNGISCWRSLWTVLAASCVRDAFLQQGQGGWSGWMGSNTRQPQKMKPAKDLRGAEVQLCVRMSQSKSNWACVTGNAPFAGQSNTTEEEWAKPSLSGGVAGRDATDWVTPHFSGVYLEKKPSPSFHNPVPHTRLCNCSTCSISNVTLEVHYEATM